MKPKTAWFLDPQKVVSILVGCGAIGSWVIGSYIADAKEAAKVESVSKQVDALDATVTTHETEIQQAEMRQQLLQKDMGYVSEAVKEILTEVKKKR